MVNMFMMYKPCICVPIECLHIPHSVGSYLQMSSFDLLVLDTRDIMDTPVAETVRKIESLGEEQYTKFVEERLELCTKPVTETLPKNKLPLFAAASWICCF